MIRYGVIGTGMMGCEHLRNILALPAGLARVTAVSDPEPSSREWAAAALGPAAADVVSFADHRELLSSGLVDAVVIASPNHTHAAVLDDVWGLPVHVMVEKPMCTTIEDCLRVRDAAAAHPGLVWVALEYRYMPPIQRFLRELPAAGDVKMMFIREHRFPFLPKVGDWNRFTRNTGGTLVEKCCHFFDLMNLALARRPVRVFASGAQDVNHLDESYGGEVPDILDNAYVIVDYEGGARACLDLCMFAEASANEQELAATGSRGKVEAFVPEGTVRVGRRRPGELHSPMDAVDARDDERIAFQGFHHGASYLEHLDFLDAIATRRAPAVDVDQGMWSVAVGLAAHRSIELGRPVTLGELGLS